MDFIVEIIKALYVVSVHTCMYLHFTLVQYLVFMMYLSSGSQPGSVWDLDSKSAISASDLEAQIDKARKVNNPVLQQSY